MATVIDGAAAAGLQETELHALQQYERIIRFRDEILAGKHATIQLPDSLRIVTPSPPSPNVRNESSAGSLPAQNNQSFASNVQHAVGQPSTDLRTIPPIVSRSVVLSNSDKLLCAELQLRRLKIEQELRDGLHENRLGKQSCAAPQDGINASAILAAALLKVPEQTFVQAEEIISSGNAAENDSFDENTFYSSQHDTPEFQPASPLLAPPTTSAPVKSVQPTSGARAVTANIHDERRNRNEQRQLRSYGELDESPVVTQKPAMFPGLNNHVDKAGASSAQSISTAQVASGLVSRPVAATQTPTSGQGPTQPSSYADLHPPSPLLQGKNREPPNLSVQPLHSSEIPGLYGTVHNVTSNVGAPAQVAALRSEPDSRTSPESSSQGGQNRRKNRRKKRKSDRQGLDNQQSFENSPQHIKSEPRSPSPIVGPSYLRPNKRQRHLKPQSQSTAFDEMTYDPAMPSVPTNGNEGPQRPSNRQVQPPAGYKGSGVYSVTGDSIPTNARVSREYVTERVITDDGYRREYVSQPAMSYEYSRGSHISRPVQQIVNRHDTYQDSPLSYRSPPQATRYSVLPEGDGFHESTRSQPARILVDAYGREYFEPARQIIRHSIAPSPLPVETERVYERAPPQPVPRYQGQGPAEERGYVFAQPASPYNAPRRIITQPEYITFDNREGRYREFSSRPLATPGEFVQVRSQEHRAYADGGREYISRASSMHPAEQTRISSGFGPYGHTASVRPEASGVIYGIDHSLPLSGIKSYGPWPTSQGVTEREAGSGGFAANEGTSSRSAPGQDPMYGRGNRSGGFR